MKTTPKVLFVLPSIHLGGTTSVLLSLLNSRLVNEITIEVLPLKGCYLHETNILNYLVDNNPFIDAFYGNYSSFSCLEKIKYLPIKLISKIPLLGTTLEKYIANNIIKNAEKAEKYDYIVAFQEGLATRFVSFIKNYPKIAWIHCDYAQNYNSSLRGKELDFYKCFNKIVCVSDYTKRGFLSVYRELSDVTVAIHNPFDVQRIIVNARAEIDDERFNSTSFTIISVGRISKVKRFFMIPKIASDLKCHGLDFKWYIIGDAIDLTEQYKIDDAILKYKVQDNVVCLGGKVNPYPYFKKANLLVTLSKSEACPMIFNEAKVLGLPVISTDFGSAYEFISQGKNGIISTLDDISSAIFEFANNPELILLSTDNSEFQCDDNLIYKKIKDLFLK